MRRGHSGRKAEERGLQVETEGVGKRGKERKGGKETRGEKERGGLRRQGQFPG